VERGEKENVFPHRQPPVEVPAPLKNRTHLREYPRIIRLCILAKHCDVSGIGTHQPEDALDRGRLARTVRPEQAHDFALFDLKSDIVDGLNRPTTPVAKPYVAQHLQSNPSLVSQE